MVRPFWPFILLPVLLILTTALFWGCAGAPAEYPTNPSAAEPPVIFEMPELVCVAEAEGVAFVPDLPIDIFYYEGRWFWKIRDTWYWSKSYMGMLYELSGRQVPRKLRKFGDTYRAELPDCREFTYDDWYRRTHQR